MAEARVTALSSERLKPQAQIPGVLYWSLGLRGIPLEMHGPGHRHKPERVEDAAYARLSAMA